VASLNVIPFHFPGSCFLAADYPPVARNTSREQHRKPEISARNVYGFSILRILQAAPDTMMLSPLQIYALVTLTLDDEDMSQDGISRTAMALLSWYMMILWALMMDQFVALLRSTQTAHVDALASPQTSVTRR
jgi:hypothetical protein